MLVIHRKEKQIDLTVEWNIFSAITGEFRRVVPTLGLSFSPCLPPPQSKENKGK